MSVAEFQRMVVGSHRVRVPLDHAEPDGESIEVFARSLVAEEYRDRSMPWLVFLQGGPGGESPRPMLRSGWIGRALRDYRVLLLDQRGTGLSTPVSAAGLADRDPEQQARYLSHFRADAIVRDCEVLRAQLAGGAKWSLLGQSYGGFCSTHYLCAAPEALREVYITGGLPPLEGHADDVYRRTYPRVAWRNERYYERYPEDVERVRELVERLDAEEHLLTGGDRLSGRRLRQLGLQFGFSDGYELVHHVVERAFAGGARAGELPRPFLVEFERALPYPTSPIFSILHEAAYCQGTASAWSAERVREEFAPFRDDHPGPVQFTGEMIYPWMFEEIASLEPLREAAHRLAEKEDWPPLYDRAVLARNEVPVAAAIYTEDMYVERQFSEQTAEAIAGTRTWRTDAYEHNGLRSDGEAVLGRLIELLRGR